MKTNRERKIFRGYDFRGIWTKISERLKFVNPHVGVNVPSLQQPHLFDTRNPSQFEHFLGFYPK